MDFFNLIEAESSTDSQGIPGTAATAPTTARQSGAASSSPSAALTTTPAAGNSPGSDQNTSTSSPGALPSPVSSLSSSATTTTAVSTTPTSSLAPLSSTSLVSTSSMASAQPNDGSLGSSPQNSTQSASSASSSGISSGALAGAVVGAAIGAALIAALLTAFFCARRRQRDKSQYYSDRRRGSGSDSFTTAKGAISLSEKEKSRTAEGVAWRAYLPQSADDGTIRHAVATLLSQIDLHVDNYYAKSDRELDAATLQRVAQFNTERLPKPLQELLSSPTTTLPTLKHCIADVLVAMITPNAEGTASLLHPRLSTLPPQLQENATSSRENTAAWQAYSQWKSLNAFLYPHAEEDAMYQQYRDQAAAEVTQLLATAFEPWQAQPGDGEAVQRNYRGLALTAAGLGQLLASQPSLYEFRWSTVTDARTASAPSNRSFVTLPGFWKVTDEGGRPLDKAQLLVSPALVRV